MKYKIGSKARPFIFLVEYTGIKIWFQKHFWQLYRFFFLTNHFALHKINLFFKCIPTSLRWFYCILYFFQTMSIYLSIWQRKNTSKDPLLKYGMLPKCVRNKVTKKIHYHSHKVVLKALVSYTKQNQHLCIQMQCIFLVSNIRVMNFIFIISIRIFINFVNVILKCLFLK